LARTYRTRAERQDYAGAVSTVEMSAREVVRILRAFDSARIDVGITGGWGIDALLRRQTRWHADLDLGVSADHVPAAIATAEAIGYVIEQDQRPARLVLRGEGGQIDLHPIVWDATGTGVQRGFDGQVFVYPPGSLAAEGAIAGHGVRCGTPELQRAFHQGYDATDRDRRDMAELAATFKLSLPEALVG
jgi:lincosamide nucleotidyltransferase A/C/D/E